MRRKQKLASALGIQKKIWITMHFSEIMKLQFGKKNAIHGFVFFCFLAYRNCYLFISKKNAWLPPIFFFGFQ